MKSVGIQAPQQLASIRVSQLMNTYIEDSNARRVAETDMRNERMNAQPRLIELALEGTLVNRSA